MKPREFWLDTYNNVLAGCAPAKPDQNIIHVIEYKAYEALKKECDVLQLEKTYYYEGLELHFNSKIDKLTEQNAWLREALHNLKCYLGDEKWTWLMGDLEPKTTKREKK